MDLLSKPRDFKWQNRSHLNGKLILKISGWYSKPSASVFIVYSYEFPKMAIDNCIASVRNLFNFRVYFTGLKAVT